MERTTPSHQEPVRSASLLEAIDGLREAVALLAERLAPYQPPPPPPPSPLPGTGPHLRLVPPPRPATEPPWEQLPVRALRAQLREAPIDRCSLPAPIENLRRAELLEALRQVEALQGGSAAP
jgi:hypothetical protein